MGASCGAPRSMERGKMAEAESLETAAEHERILREIESTDTACIGPTLRYPGARATHGGTSGTGGWAPPGPWVCPAVAGSVPAPPSGEPGEPPPPLAWRASLGSPGVGSLPDRRLPQPGTLKAPRSLRAGATFLLPPRLARRRATGTRRTDGGFYPLFPQDISPRPPTRTSFCFADKIEFLPMVCWEIKRLPP